MRKEIDINIGDKFNRWTVVGDVFYKTFPNGSKSKFVDCVCLCGTKKTIRCGSLTSPTKPSISCGCYAKEVNSEYKNVVQIGDKFHRLTVLVPRIQIERPDGSFRHYCEVICDCGTSEPLQVRYESLKSGKTKSCSCYQKERVSESATTHGMSKTSAYNSWQQMRDRCSNPNNNRYETYGAVGINYPDKWGTFTNFWEDMSEGWFEGAFIDRINYKESYSKDNCRWVALDVSNHNKSKPATCSSKYKGVYYDKSKDKWTTRLGRNGVSYLFKRFTCELEAAIAYDDMSEQVYGDRPNETYFGLTRESISEQLKEINNGTSI